MTDSTAEERLVEAARELAKYAEIITQCQCDEAYTSRRMHGPNTFCGYLDEEIAAVRAAIEEATQGECECGHQRGEHHPECVAYLGERITRKAGQQYCPCQGFKPVPEPVEEARRDGDLDQAMSKVYPPWGTLPQATQQSIIEWMKRHPAAVPAEVGPLEERDG